MKAEPRGGSGCLNSFELFLRWISRSGTALARRRCEAIFPYPALLLDANDQRLGRSYLAVRH